MPLPHIAVHQTGTWTSIPRHRPRHRHHHSDLDLWPPEYNQVIIKGKSLPILVYCIFQYWSTARPRSAIQQRPPDITRIFLDFMSRWAIAGLHCHITQHLLTYILTGWKSGLVAVNIIQTTRWRVGCPIRSTNYKSSWMLHDSSSVLESMTESSMSSGTTYTGCRFQTRLSLKAKPSVTDKKYKYIHEYYKSSIQICQSAKPSETAEPIVHHIVHIANLNAQHDEGTLAN